MIIVIIYIVKIVIIYYFYLFILKNNLLGKNACYTFNRHHELNLEGNKLKKQLLLGAVSFSLIGGLATTSYASAASNTETNIETNESQETLSDTQTQEIINKADKYIVIENNKFVLKDNNTLTNSELIFVKDSLQRANESLKDVNLDGAEVTGNHFTVSTSPSTSGFTTLAVKEGKRDAKYYWWGAKIWLTKTDVGAILNSGIAVGSTIIGSFGGIPGAAAGAAAGAIISQYSKPVPVIATINYAKFASSTTRLSAITVIPQ